MPWHIMQGSDSCPASKPWAVMKGDSGDHSGPVVGCHESEDSARAQMRALYASEGGKMAVRASYMTDITSMQFDEENGKFTNWVHALPIGTYKHPMYGTIDLTQNRVQKFVENVKNKVRGIEPSINYVHNNNGAAAGWVKDAEARSDGVWLFVEWVKDAAQSIKDGKWKYFSAEFDDVWEDPQGNKFNDVLFGGALTNRPFMKNLVPINLSEATIEGAFELVSAIKGTSVESLKGGETTMTEDEMKKLAEMVTENLKNSVKKTEEPKEGSLDLSEVHELRQLAEENPLVKALLNTVESTGVTLAETQRKLQEEQVTAKLAEFDRSKIVLTPVARELVHRLLMEMPVKLQEDFWKLMTSMRTSNALLVELGERAGARVQYGEDKTAKQRFTEATNVYIAGGMSYPDAVQKVAEENPGLYDEYRTESFAFRTTN